MNAQFIGGAPVTVLGWTAVAFAADDTQRPTRGWDAGPEIPDIASDPVGGLLVDGLSR